jgi:hypothetical protein
MDIRKATEIVFWVARAEMGEAIKYHPHEILQAIAVYLTYYVGGE